MGARRGTPTDMQPSLLSLGHRHHIRASDLYAAVECFASGRMPSGLQCRAWRSSGDALALEGLGLEKERNIDFAKAQLILCAYINLSPTGLRFLSPASPD